MLPIFFGSASEAQLQKAKEMEQDSKAAADAAERFKADLQPGLESFKDRILALEEQLQSGDQLQARALCQRVAFATLPAAT